MIAIPSPALPRLVFCLCLFPACSTQGADQVVADRFDYNQAVATSGNEQMLLNLVRLRYSNVPTFLQVSSVLTQYIWAGSVGVEASGGEALGFDQLLVGGAAAYRYAERPTITYSPLTGEEFAEQLTMPVPLELIFSLMQSGWPPEQLLVMGLQRIHDLHNIATISLETVDDEFINSFRETMSLFVEVAKRGGVESQVSEEEGEEDLRRIVFEQDADPETQQLIDEFKAAIGLDPGISTFNVTTRVIGRAPDEVTVRVRSVLDIMGFLALGVEVPSEHLEVGRVLASDVGLEDEPLVPLHVRSSSEPPTDAFAAVHYGDHWFYIPRSDQRSKQAFSLLTYLFIMQAPRIQGAGPLITVPT